MQNIKSKNPKLSKGFTLILTISLMVLLTVIGVGYLSLSTISLRTSSHGEAMAIARSNARMALMMALGELQKAAGPDQRITARADITSTNNVAQPYMTGVWASYNTALNSPSSNEFSAQTKSGNFLTWLVSAPDNASKASLSYPSSQATENSVKLWGENSFGKNNSNASSLTVAAEKVTITNAGNRQGSLAWAVADEGIKARINTFYESPVNNLASQGEQLISGKRARAEMLNGMEALNSSSFKANGTDKNSIDKGITDENASLAFNQLANGTGDILKQYKHDVSTSSLGLLVDVTTGGLKEDFHLLTEGGSITATPYNGTGATSKSLFNSRLKLSGSLTNATATDSKWFNFYQFSTMHRRSGALTKATSGVPNAPMTTSITGWVGAADQYQKTNNQSQVASVYPNTPPANPLVPAIAKVQLAFSVIARDLFKGDGSTLHTPWGDRVKSSGYKYEVHLVVTPIVTLYNPYNVQLTCANMRVDFLYAPFAMQCFRNGQPMSNDLIPMDDMRVNANIGNTVKPFGMNLFQKSATGSPGSQTITLLPGETKIFSPYFEPSQKWESQAATYFDWKTGGATGVEFSADMQSISGLRTPSAGFEMDYIVGESGAPADASLNRGRMFVVKPTDELTFKFAPQSIASSQNKFVVRLSRDNGGTLVPLTAVELQYNENTGLRKKFLGSATGSYGYPKAGSLKAEDIHEIYTKAYKDEINARTMACFSFHAKTTYGGYDEGEGSYEEGRSAAMPWAYTSPVLGGASKCNLNSAISDSHEANFLPLYSNSDAIRQFQVGINDRGRYITGLTTRKGTPNGVLYEIPTGPIKSLTQLNGANPGGSAGMGARFAQPIGNSWASPSLATSAAFQSSTVSNGTAGATVFTSYDHCFLLNRALYDHFYLSGLGTRGSVFSDGATAITNMQNFASGKSGVGLDPRLEYHAPDGTGDKMETKLAATAANRAAQVAAWQQMKGAFNINSTSVNAWKAMLASIQNEGSAKFIKLTNSASSSTAALSTLAATDSKKAAFSRFALPVSDFTDSHKYWLGGFELDNGQLQILAQNIVNEIKKRGPFLSLSEFVNRQLGPSGDLTNKGALQAAIELSGINEALKPNSASNPDENSGYNISLNNLTGVGLTSPSAMVGNGSRGAPGSLTQADIMAVLGNAATPRSDTFVIRAYGDAKDNTGKVIASAYCEATVQRQIEYVDSTESAYASDVTQQPNATLKSYYTTNGILAKPDNLYFGRKFTIQSFKWLSNDEV